MTHCRLCDHFTSHCFDSKVMRSLQVSYYHCDHCRLLQTEEPYWLKEAYRHPVNVLDTGLVQRNVTFSRWVSVILYFYFRPDGQFLDFAGGCGLFTRVMRDIGFDFYWSDKYASNLFSRGFEGSRASRYDLATALECFEHFVHPGSEIQKLLTLSDSVLFSTLLRPQEIPDRSWWYYGFEHGQHVSFYSLETLNYISRTTGLNLVSNGRDVHLLTPRPVSQRAFSLILKLANYGLFHYVKSVMRSRAHDDMHYLTKSMKDEE